MRIVLSERLLSPMRSSQAKELGGSFTKEACCVELG